MTTRPSATCMRQIVGNETRYEFMEADGGEEGLRLAREKKPDVIILDLQMPAVDGFTVLQQLAADDRTSAIPIVVSTSMTIDAALRSRLPEHVRLISKNAISRESVSLVPARRRSGCRMSAGEKIVVLNVDDLESQRYVKTTRPGRGRIRRDRGPDRRGSAAPGRAAQAACRAARRSTARHQRLRGLRLHQAEVAGGDGAADIGDLHDDRGSRRAA